MSPEPRLVLQHDPSKVAALHHAKPLTIGRAADNRLCLPTTEEVAPHHAVVRFSRSHGWLVCDWGSPEGTYLEGQRIRHCRPLSDGDEIRLGSRGPVLVFQLQGEPAAVSAGSTTPAPHPSRPRTPPSPKAGAGAPLAFAGQRIPLDRILSAHVRSRARHPHSFSWWVLISLGGLVLLPWPALFWPLEIGALVAWILLGSRKDHALIVTLRDGMAHRHGFASRITALAHRNGIRKAIGQSLEGG